MPKNICIKKLQSYSLAFVILMTLIVAKIRFRDNYLRHFSFILFFVHLLNKNREMDCDEQKEDKQKMLGLTWTKIWQHLNDFDRRRASKNFRWNVFWENAAFCLKINKSTQFLKKYSSNLDQSDIIAPIKHHHNHKMYKMRKETQEILISTEKKRNIESFQIDLRFKCCFHAS